MKTHTKLTLHTETLRNMTDEQELSAVKGGAWGVTTVSGGNSQCPNPGNSIVRTLCL